MKCRNYFSLALFARRSGPVHSSSVRNSHFACSPEAENARAIGLFIFRAKGILNPPVLLYYRSRRAYAPNRRPLIERRQPRGLEKDTAMSSTSPVDPNQRFVTTLESNALSLFVVSIVGGALSLIVVGLRTFVRLRAKNFGLDDGLMLGGLVSKHTSWASEPQLGMR